MTLSDLRRWLEELAETEATIPAAQVLRRLPELAVVPERDPEHTGALAAATWREKLWTVPAETRLGREELLEALGRPRSWLYRHTGPAAENRIPHRELEGTLVFVAGEVRAWLRAHEESEVEGPIESTLPERGLRSLG